MKKITFIQVFLIVLCIMLIFMSDVSAAAAKDAVGRCLTIIIPSLFVFMALSSMIVKSGAYKVLSLPFYPVAKYVLKMPYELFSVFLISNLAGFPVGASMLRTLINDKKITPETASVMQCYCYGGGPSFSLGVIGMVIYQDKITGAIICLSSILANLTCAVLLNRAFSIKKTNYDNPDSFDSSDFIECIGSSGRSILMICALIIAFAVLLRIMAIPVSAVSAYFGSYPSKDASVLIRSLFELSSITAMSKGYLSVIPIISGIFCFGGICILIQVICTVKNSYSLIPFFITRLPVSLLAFLYSKGLVYFFSDKIKECFAAQENVMVNLNNFLPSICLILMIFLLTFSKGVAFFRKI